MPGLLDDGASVERIIKQYKAVRHDCSSDTMHGAFLDICVNS